MAVPKRKTSRSNTRTRKAQWRKLTPPDVVPIVVDGKRKLVPRRLVAYYQRYGDGHRS